MKGGLKMTDETRNRVDLIEAAIRQMCDELSRTPKEQTWRKKVKALFKRIGQVPK